MIERAFFIIWGIWLLLLFVAACRVFGFLSARRRQDRLWGDGSRNQKPVALILAVKGFDLNSSPRFFDAILAQNYSNYRVIVCFESWDDTIAQWLKEQFELPGEGDVWTHPDPGSGLKSVTLVCAGAANDEGQKVHNQRAAFDALTAEDLIVAFADADIYCKQDWLAKLVAPINQDTHTLSTTYRWLIPKRPTLPAQLASVINGSITTQGGSEITNVLWGGSMAISREVFDSLDVPQLFAGSLNDDLRLSKAARRAGNRIAFVRSLILPSMIDFNWRSFVEFTKRQYTQVKFFSPILYTGTNFVLGFYVLGLASIIAALVYGYFYAWIPLAAAYVIDQFRALARQQIYLSLFEEHGIRRKLFAASWLEHMLTPLWMVLHWLLLVSTWSQSRITWAGIRYRILSKSKTKVLSRPVIAERLPVGVPGLSLMSDLRDRHFTRRGTTTPQKSESIPSVVSEAGPSESKKSPSSRNEIEEMVAEISGKQTVPEKLPGKTEVASSSEPVSHPGGPSAVIPINSRRPRRALQQKSETPVRLKAGVSRLELRMKKTRVLPRTRYSVPGIGGERDQTRTVGPKNTRTSAAVLLSDSHKFKWPPTRSFAAQRATRKGDNRGKSSRRKGTPVLSTRTYPSIRRRKQKVSRKGARRISSRP